MEIVDILEKILILAGMVTLGFAIGMLFNGIARKVSARIQNRVGPPVYQGFIDVFKLFGKKTNISHGWIFDLAALFSVSGIALAFLFLPVAGYSMLSTDGDLFLILYLLAIPALGFALGAGASGNPNAAVGVMRALMSMLAYELPLVMVMVAMMVYYNTTSLANIVAAQANMQWAFFIPIFFIGALVADMALQGMLMEKPFDIPIAPHEIATGPMVEFGGKHLGALMLYKMMGTVVETTLFVDLFLGGGVVLSVAQYGWLAYLVNFAVWFVLILIVFLIAVMIDNVLPRFRIEQALKFYWKYDALIAIFILIWIFAGVKI
ncbi:MAG: NADH-quinone oxidoreductase subunit H [Euryarchaeota archaeon]|nr:NADH-quinone oxidoreductase subunit H [Euryarchaeota archaeon]